MTKYVHMTRNRPERCELCHLCVVRPKDEVPYNSKFTHFCLMMKKELSGRVTKAVDPHHRKTCSPAVYKKVWDTHDGNLPISDDDIRRYEQIQMWLPFNDI